MRLAKTNDMRENSAQPARLPRASLIEHLLHIHAEMDGTVAERPKAQSGVADRWYAVAAIGTSRPCATHYALTPLQQLPLPNGSSSSAT